jgi:hypothetical protein
MNPAFASILAALLLLTHPTLATDNHTYRDGEYAIISGGTSPDGRWSIAAHGEGEYGYDRFDLFLLREPAHEKVAPLRTGGGRDTAPLSLAALWAPDSSHVAVLYRIDLHLLELQLFALAGGRLQSIAVPPLVETAGRKYLLAAANRALFSRFYRFTWETPARFVLEEYDGYDARGPVFRSGLDAYLKVDRRGPERTFTDFAASATCEITAKQEVRIGHLQPQPKWPDTIQYTPHLLYEWGLGLHDTESTMSSISAQKESR